MHRLMLLGIGLVLVLSTGCAVHGSVGHRGYPHHPHSGIDVYWYTNGLFGGGTYLEAEDQNGGWIRIRGHHLEIPGNKRQRRFRIVSDVRVINPTYTYDGVTRTIGRSRSRSSYGSGPQNARVFALTNYGDGNHSLVVKFSTQEPEYEAESHEWHFLVFNEH